MINIVKIEEITKDLQELPNVRAVAKNDDRANQAKIHNEIVQDLLKYFDRINEEQARNIVRLFAMRKFRNLKIIY